MEILVKFKKTHQQVEELTQKCGSLCEYTDGKELQSIRGKTARGQTRVYLDRPVMYVHRPHVGILSEDESVACIKTKDFFKSPKNEMTDGRGYCLHIDGVYLGRAQLNFSLF